MKRSHLTVSLKTLLGRHTFPYSTSTTSHIGQHQVIQRLLHIRTAALRTNMAATKTEAPPAPKPSCCACGESPDTSFIRPCRDCDTDYCYGCLHEMFIGATKDSTRMPPRCCSFLQIHTAVAALTDMEAGK